MSKFNYRRPFNAFTPALTLAMLLGASGTTLADESMKKEKVVSINEYTCERLISATSHNRAAAIAFLHGYRAGMAGKKTIDTEKLGITSDRLVVHCLDNRTDTAVVALDKVSKTIKN
ncbi:MAG: HdeA/HdeB family chaperone [Gammaproteobacteria bacterium]|nr:HdeA/HdeB family chaperone [Gammaproteobacteria bacterium]